MLMSHQPRFIPCIVNVFLLLSMLPIAHFRASWMTPFISHSAADLWPGIVLDKLFALVSWLAYPAAPSASLVATFETVPVFSFAFFSLGSSSSASA